MVVAVVAACVAAAPVAAAVGGSVLGSTALAAAATTTATTAAEIAVVAAAGSIVAEKKERRNNSVYVLRDSTGDVQYVGRTTNVSVRKNAHNLNPARRGLKMEVIASGLNYDEARALEQAGMIYYHTINPSNKTNNQINGVAPTKWNKYKGVAQKVISYGENMMTNELLYWLGM